MSQQVTRDLGVPPGWQDNPSTWPQRLPIVGAALVGFAIVVLALAPVGRMGYDRYGGGWARSGAPTRCPAERESGRS